MKLFVRISAFLPALAIMAAIFILSSQPAAESSRTSANFIELVAKYIVPDYGSKSSTEKNDIIDSMQFTVRKCAHATAYTALAVTLFFGYSLSLSKIALQSLAAWITALIFSVSDEFHQFFVPGRSCEFRDICIDSGGALFGVLLCIGFYTIIKKSANKKKI